ncbi:MAG TPA: carbohydrate ABC transporter permease, partial [Candidatus Aerophobetes bacterium]|nr:carbohydrate ABC transporter permease [Candidatus Aerophobetes bacterium]
VIMAVILIILCLTLFPFYWMILTSFKPRTELFTLPPDWIPKTPTLKNYYDVLFSVKAERLNFITYFKNSVIVCTTVVALTLILAVPAGYSFSRFRFGGRRAVLNLVLISQMLPIVMLLIPFYIAFRKLGLLNTYICVILPYLVFTLPFSMWMLKGYFDTIPTELEDAAMVDGCTKLGAMGKVILPNILPGIIATSIVAFMMAWDEYIIALTLLARDEMRTLPPGIVLSFVGEFEIRWGPMMAASVIISLPVMLIFAFLHKHLIAGLTAGAVKG